MPDGAHSLTHIADAGFGLDGLAAIEGPGARGVAVDTRREAGRAFMRSALDGLCKGSTPIPPPLKTEAELGLKPGVLRSAREIADARLADAFAAIDAAWAQAGKVA